MATHRLQLIDKKDVTKQKIISFTPPSAQAVPVGSIRAQTCLIGLTANNTSYAKLGDFLSWWTAYPTPNEAHQDASSYGIVPGWGFGRIIESGVDALKQGDLLYGFWPFHDAPVDLQLNNHPYGSADNRSQSYWVETSSHRQKMMAFYNRYFHFQGGLPTSPAELDAYAWRANMRPLWETGFLATRFVWPPRDALEKDEQVHPFGENLQWTRDDGDVSKTVFVILGASGRTSMCFVSELRSRGDDNRPAGIIAVTSARSTSQVQGTQFFDKVLTYAEAGDGQQLRAAVTEASSLATRVVILDVGGQGDSVQDSYDALQGHVSHVRLVKVGGDIKQLDPAVQKAAQENAQRMGAIQMNANGIQQDALKKVGEVRYWKDSWAKWDEFVVGPKIPGMHLVWGKGVAGAEGIEGGWARTCSGQVGANEALVYSF